MKILCLHGIGHQDDPARAATWKQLWQSAIDQNIGATPDIEFWEYDRFFEAPLARLSHADFAKAFWHLGGGVVFSPRGLLDLSDSTRWHAGMVAVWVNEEDLRATLREQLLAAMQSYQPDLILAHSLGSLIAYDAFARDHDAIRNKTLVTFGSQIGNLFVRGAAFAGRVEPLQTAARWFHLYNPYDHAFTAPLDFGAFRTAMNFQQVLTPFGHFLSGFADNHRAVNPANPDHAYLTNAQTRSTVWPQIAGAARPKAVPARAAQEIATLAVPNRRALLIGINEYSDQAHRLHGCVNDVFLISSVLQECSFDAEDIRVVVDNRATTANIHERLHWLLDDVKAGDIRFLYYSGHGAQVPIYGPEGTIDRVAACLVPYDFRWTAETALTDQVLVNFYSQLPYDSRFMMVLDCCYAGGLTRGGTRARGLDPPDDIRHHMLRWDCEAQMWVARNLKPLNRDLLKHKEGKQYVGEAGATLRLGRGVSLRVLHDKEYDDTRKKLGHQGPYLPIIYEACGEQEFSYEYQHGAIAHGAFTYALAATLRRAEAGHKSVTFTELLKETGKVLKDLRYDQHPEIAGPKGVLQAAIPWHSARATESSPRR